MLRHRFSVHVVDLKLMGETAKQVEEISGIGKDNTRVNAEIAEGFVMLRNVATALAVILVVMLVVVSLFIISNTIRITTFTRREEIAIMKMCGATNWFIRWPFLVLIPFRELSRVILTVFLGTGFLIGAGGSAMAIRKFLRV